ncbi:GntR family transcriptional regulator [Rhizobium sp. WL3]|jgi:DNA-binding GntR family transcriptional regulator|uniref:GntR family transcriptional regulator n=1 Tax=Rhizobium sp. WL3 TaxID=2603277 RepID=UPI0011C203C2|nr:GntR family transcriptional regulator [Rhizobium sp. WL3]QEE45187.1 GntR family transcriptional regulator [Rhizobium sp. WL3]
MKDRATARQASPGGENSLRQLAYSRIEELLNWGRLRPGQIISQRELVETTEMTLSAIREAIPRLEAEGLLQTLPQRGLMVPSLDVTFIREAYQMRRVIELSAIPDLIQRLDRAVIRNWLDWHTAARERLSSDETVDLQIFLRDLQVYDWHMHAAMVGAMENSLISNVYRVTAIKIRMTAQARVRVTRDNAKRVIAEHIAFLTPMLEGSADAAAEALSRHIDQSLTIALGGTVAN